MPFVEQPFRKINLSSSLSSSSAKIKYVLKTSLFKQYLEKLIYLVGRFHTTEGSVDGCSVQIIVGIL